MGSAAISISAGSDAGRLRENNQDSYLVAPPPADKAASHGHLLLLADGMGGHAAGEVASRMAVETASEAYYDSVLGGEDDIPRALTGALQAANHAILLEGSRNAERCGMGTTCSGVLVREDRFWICHVGDSRIYRYRAGQLDRLTKDHTLLTQMLESGDITPREAQQLSIRHILVRALGIESDLDVDVSEHAFPLRPGDKVLLCSDGLFSVLGDEDIARTLTERAGDEAVSAFIDAANAGGGPDNITVVLLER